MEASAEEHQQELLQAQNLHQTQLQALEQQAAKEKKEYVERQRDLQRQMEVLNRRAERAEAELELLSQSHESQLAEASHQESRALQRAEDKLVQTLAQLDDRDEQIAALKTQIKTLKASMNEHQEGAEEAEQEVEELHDENDALQEQVERLEAECARLREQTSSLEGEASQVGALQMELTLVREERDRERAKNHSMVQSTESSNAQLETERDSALAEARDVQQQLTAALADLDVAKADQERILTANNNLQAALEAFQDERQAEMKLIDEQRAESEEALRSAHAASMEALKQTHAQEIRNLQFSAEESLKQAQNETKLVMAKVDKLQSENIQTRRSLDEAIQRLQTTQEDIIDRTLMKNILLDWCTMKDKDKRHQVLQLMASVLHFTDEEKEKVHLTHLDIESVRSKVVGAIAAPLPPSKAQMDALEGENVSEKWVNFLMAETDDGL